MNAVGNVPASAGGEGASPEGRKPVSPREIALAKTLARRLNYVLDEYAKEHDAEKVADFGYFLQELFAPMFDELLGVGKWDWDTAGSDIAVVVEDGEEDE